MLTNTRSQASHVTLQFDMSGLGQISLMTPTLEGNNNGVSVDLGSAHSLPRATFWRKKKKFSWRSNLNNPKLKPGSIPGGNHSTSFSWMRSNSSFGLFGFAAVDSVAPMHNWGTSSVVDTRSSKIGSVSGSLMGMNCTPKQGGIPGLKADYSIFHTNSHVPVDTQNIVMLTPVRHQGFVVCCKNATVICLIEELNAPTGACPWQQ